MYAKLVLVVGVHLGVLVLSLVECIAFCLMMLDHSEITHVNHFCLFGMCMDVVRVLGNQLETFFGIIF